MTLSVLPKLDTTVQTPEGVPRSLALFKSECIGCRAFYFLKGNH